MAGRDGSELVCSTAATDDDLNDNSTGSHSHTATDFDRRCRIVPSRTASIRPQAAAARPAAWCFGDPDAERRRRVASYKAYSVEGKVKASLLRGLRWVKGKFSDLMSGW